MADTVNRVLLPGHTLLLEGCDVIDAELFTESTAAVDVADPGHAELVAITLYWLLFINAVMPFRVSVDDVSPGISAKFAPPSVLTCH